MNIIITGASSGIGFEAVLKLSENADHKIIAIARSEDKLAHLKHLCGNMNPHTAVHTLAFDVLGDGYPTLSQLIETEFSGKVDVLINNAGILFNASFAELNDSDFELLWRNNLLGPVKMIKAVLPVLSSGSHIVNIGSMGGFQGSVKFPGLSAYSSSKAALHNLTECLAEEFKDKGIKVNCLALGSAQTEMLEKAFPGYQSPVNAQEMGGFLADFAINGQRFFNGKIIPVAVTVP